MSLVSSLSSIIGATDQTKPVSAILAKVSSTDNSKIVEQVPFQYFPETISDNRSVEYATKTPIGSSHPIYQWVGGSPRIISFQAILTADLMPPVSQTPEGRLLQAGEALSNLVKNPVATVGSALASTFSSKVDPTMKKYNLDIARMIAWFRSMTYADYDGAKVDPPPKLILYLPNSGITSGVKIGGISIQDSVTCLMMNCNVTYEAFFRNGVPRVVVVDLEFAELIQVGKAFWNYTSRSSIDAFWKDNQLSKNTIGVLKVNDDTIPVGKSSSDVAGLVGNNPLVSKVDNFVKGLTGRLG